MVGSHSASYTSVGVSDGSSFVLFHVVSIIFLESLGSSVLTKTMNCFHCFQNTYLYHGIFIYPLIFIIFHVFLSLVLCKEGVCMGAQTHLSMYGGQALT